MLLDFYIIMNCKVNGPGITRDKISMRNKTGKVE